MKKLIESFKSQPQKDIIVYSPKNVSFRGNSIMKKDNLERKTEKKVSFSPTEQKQKADENKIRFQIQKKFEEPKTKIQKIKIANKKGPKDINELLSQPKMSEEEKMIKNINQLKSQLGLPLTDLRVKNKPGQDRFLQNQLFTKNISPQKQFVSTTHETNPINVNQTFQNMSYQNTFSPSSGQVKSFTSNDQDQNYQIDFSQAQMLDNLNSMSLTKENDLDLIPQKLSPPNINNAQGSHSKIKLQNKQIQAQQDPQTFYNNVQAIISKKKKKRIRRIPKRDRIRYQSVPESNQNETTSINLDTIYRRKNRHPLRQSSRDSSQQRTNSDLTSPGFRNQRKSPKVRQFLNISKENCTRNSGVVADKVYLLEQLMTDKTSLYQTLNFKLRELDSINWDKRKIQDQLFSTMQLVQQLERAALSENVTMNSTAFEFKDREILKSVTRENLVLKHEIEAAKKFLFTLDEQQKEIQRKFMSLNEGKLIKTSMNFPQILQYSEEIKLLVERTQNEFDYLSQQQQELDQQLQFLQQNIALGIEQNYQLRIKQEQTNFLNFDELEVAKRHQRDIYFNMRYQTRYGLSAIFVKKINNIYKRRMTEYFRDIQARNKIADAKFSGLIKFVKLFHRSE